MANTIDLISAVYDSLARLLNITGSNPAVVLQMAWPGFSLSPSDFKRSGAPGGPYDPVVARETASRIANIVPALSKLRFDNSGFEVDDLYEILISSAIPVGVARDHVAASPLTRLFSDAQYALLQARLGAHDNPNVFYYPSETTPDDWYDESVSQGWTQVTLTSADVAPVVPATSPFVKAGGLALAQQGIWRLKPTPMNTSSIRASSEQLAAVKKQRFGRFRPRPIAGGRSGGPLDVQRAEAIRIAAIDPTLPEPSFIHSSAFIEGMRAARNKALFSDVATALNGFAGSAARDELKRVALDQKDLGMSSLNVSKRMLLKSLVYESLPAKPSSMMTDGFSMSFQLCQVSIRRPWLNLALLSTRSWYMFNTPKGTYSTGELENNPGIFSLMPTSFIVARNLKITANWSPADRQDLSNAASFGPFVLLGSTVSSSTIESRGMQIIAWISRLMPLMPPMPPR